MNKSNNGLFDCKLRNTVLLPTLLLNMFDIRTYFNVSTKEWINEVKLNSSTNMDITKIINHQRIWKMSESRTPTIRSSYFGQSPISITMTGAISMASQLTSFRLVYSIVYSGEIKENVKAPRHWPLCGEFTGPGEFPAQRASNLENVSTWWRHHFRSFSVDFSHECIVAQYLTVKATTTLHRGTIKWKALYQKLFSCHESHMIYVLPTLLRPLRNVHMLFFSTLRRSTLIFYGNPTPCVYVGRVGCNDFVSNTYMVICYSRTRNRRNISRI